jgi:hypothetical protein
MKQYASFIFDSYEWHPSTGKVELKYSLDDEVHFLETLTFPAPPTVLHGRESEFDRALFALHLIGGVSYYKTCLPRKIEIRSGTLSPEQAKFWNTVYENGLGEFFFRNNIDFTGLLNFPSGIDVKAPSSTTPQHATRNPKLLVPVGGGKDSVVTVEKLKKSGADITLLRMGHHPLIDTLANAMGLPLLTIDRALSAELFKLNAEGALNGHIPITAYLSFVTVVTSILYGFDQVAMSNERSANFGNIEFHGKEINHQWSKSEEFEKLFQDYVHRHITPGVHVFSALREMTELQVVEQFAKYPQYFSCTTSCNTNWKILAAPRGRDSGFTWCGRCPKCAFVFALYAAYLPKDTVLNIFGKNLFDDPSLKPLYKQLLGLEGFKPFECVGTPEEARGAFTLAQKNGFTVPSL